MTYAQMPDLPQEQELSPMNDEDFDTYFSRCMHTQQPETKLSLLAHS